MSSKYSADLSNSEMQKILSEEDTGCLCLNGNDYPYGVPVSYAFIDGKIVFHSALSGKKLDHIRMNPRVCFTVSRHIDRMKPHQPEGTCQYHFESVVCFGNAEVIDDIKTRFDHLKRFKSYFYKRLNLDDNSDPVTEAAAEKCTCTVINIKKMTGRRK